MKSISTEKRNRGSKLKLRSTEKPSGRAEAEVNGKMKPRRAKWGRSTAILNGLALSSGKIDLTKQNAARDIRKADSLFNRKA